MPFDLTLAVETACAASPWDLGNAVLYELCRKHPLHKEVPAVIAKVWLIGRSYAAAIERGRVKEVDEKGDFYVETVAPRVIGSEIDKWLAEASRYSVPNEKSVGTMLLAHANVTHLFRDISRFERRSLASKYLHFHFPILFYIYDSRAAEAMRLLSPLVGRVRSTNLDCDIEYQAFVEKCLRLQTHIRSTHGRRLTPRQIDNLLLHIYANGIDDFLRRPA